MTQTAKQFWSWFEKNNVAYIFVNEVEHEIKERLLDDLMEQLHLYCDKLFFEIGGDQELIITAEGDSNYFQTVEALIAEAPQLNDWKFIAFIPPRNSGYSINYENISLEPSKIWFDPLENPKEPELIGIKLYLPNFELVKDNKWLRPAAYKLLEMLLGEKSFALDIGYVDIDQLPNDPEREELLKLTDLFTYVTFIKSKPL